MQGSYTSSHGQIQTPQIEVFKLFLTELAINFKQFRERYPKFDTENFTLNSKCAPKNLQHPFRMNAEIWDQRWARADGGDTDRRGESSLTQTLRARSTVCMYDRYTAPVTPPGHFWMNPSTTWS